MIQINNLIKSFDKKVAVDMASLSIKQGEILGVVGNNGAGKTTFFRLLLDLLQADSGYVTFFDKDVSKSEEWKTYTGSFIDNSFLIECLFPEEYFDFIGKVYQINEEDIRERLKDYSQLMNGEILEQKKYIRNMSSGNKQKIGITGAMLINPKILILDEPFNFLDPSSQIEMKRLLLHLNKTLNTTILVSSHNIQYIADICSRIILLEKGNIIRDEKAVTAETKTELENYFRM